MKEEWWGNAPASAIKPGLDRIAALLAALGHPEMDYPIVHVAGTNGKGSTAAMITAGLTAQGYRVGLNISPDLGQINQRVSLNRTPIDPGLWDTLGAEVERAGFMLAQTPSFFEAVTALAFLAFSRLQVDIAVVEVGLGGRWDATNVIGPPLLSVITPIAYDHMDRLGDTIEAIAGEKAGILKAGSELVLARQTYPAAARVIRERARDLGVPVFEPEGDAWSGPEGAFYSTSATTVHAPLLGTYQAVNLAAAWTAIEVLARMGWIDDLDAARGGIADVRWPGRFQLLKTHPPVLLDGAHNLHGIGAVAESLAEEPWREIEWHLVFGTLSDKPAPKMLEKLLPLVSRVYLTAVPGMRQGRPETLLASVEPRLQPQLFADPALALKRALEDSQTRPRGGVLVTGSLALLACLFQSHPYSILK